MTKTNTPARRTDGNQDEQSRAEAQRIFRAVALLLARYEVRNLKRIFDEFERDILLPILLGEIALHNLGELENGREVKESATNEDGV